MSGQIERLQPFDDERARALGPWAGPEPCETAPEPRHQLISVGGEIDGRRHGTDVRPDALHGAPG